MKLKLQVERENQNLSKADLARIACMQAGMIAWIESGRFVPYDSQLIKLAAALGFDGEPALLIQPVEQEER